MFELIVNAICHRDYASHASVQVMLFPDRLEIWNPGSLPRGWTVEMLLRPHTSLPPNELMAMPMYLKGYIEKMGTGTEDVAKLCAKNGLSAPSFAEVCGDKLRNVSGRIQIRRGKHLYRPFAGLSACRSHI